MEDTKCCSFNWLLTDTSLCQQCVCVTVWMCVCVCVCQLRAGSSWTVTPSDGCIPPLESCCLSITAVFNDSMRCAFLMLSEFRLILFWLLWYWWGGQTVNPVSPWKWPLKRCVCVCACVRACVCVYVSTGASKRGRVLPKYGVEGTSIYIQGAAK